MKRFLAHLLLFAAASLLAPLWAGTLMPQRYGATEGAAALLDQAAQNIFWARYPIWIGGLMLALGAVFVCRSRFGAFALASSVAFLTYEADQGAKRAVAEDYVTLFEHQSVAEERRLDPLLEGGEAAAELLLDQVENKDYPFRRYVIAAFGELRYTAAVPTLERVLSDPRESDALRSDALDALQATYRDEGTRAGTSAIAALPSP